LLKLPSIPSPPTSPPTHTLPPSPHQNGWCFKGTSHGDKWKNMMGQR
jgi:hypothetical protein